MILISVFCQRLFAIVDGDDSGEKSIGTCTVECMRTDGKPLGWGLQSDDDDEIRRAFAFTSAPATTKYPYKGPSLVHCRQLPFSYGKLGGTVWYAAIALAQYIAMNPSIVRGKDVLELGAGIGIPGLLASGCDARSVCLSEFGYDGDINEPVIQPEGEDSKRLLPSALLSNLNFNVNLNSGDNEKVSVKHVDWYDFIPNEDGSDNVKIQGNTFNKDDYDLLIGSDLVNWEEDVRPLISTLKYFLSGDRNTKAILMLSVENRKALPTFLELIETEFTSVDTKNMSMMNKAEELPLLLITLSMQKPN